MAWISRRAVSLYGRNKRKGACSGSRDACKCRRLHLHLLRLVTARDCSTKRTKRSRSEVNNYRATEAFQPCRISNYKAVICRNTRLVRSPHFALFTNRISSRNLASPSENAHQISGKDEVVMHKQARCHHSASNDCGDRGFSLNFDRAQLGSRAT
jgi:hypothetical protein